MVRCGDMRPSPGEESAPVNWSNKGTLVTSIQFHQTFSDAGLRLGTRACDETRQGDLWATTTTEQKAMALDDVSVGSFLKASGLREMGLGAVTVAECAVGLRIVGDLPELESPLTQGVAPQPPFAPLEADRARCIEPPSPPKPDPSTHRALRRLSGTADWNARQP